MVLASPPINFMIRRTAALVNGKAQLYDRLAAQSRPVFVHAVLRCSPLPFRSVFTLTRRTHRSLRSTEILLTLSFNPASRGFRYAQLLSRHERLRLIGDVRAGRARFPFEQKLRRSSNWIESRGKGNSLRYVNRVDTLARISVTEAKNQVHWSPIRFSLHSINALFGEVEFELATLFVADPRCSDPIQN